MLLGVNIDHVATLRNARGGIEPDVITAARICKDCKVASITTHLREDRRHIKDADVEAIRMLPRTRLNLEMAMTQEMLDIALRLRPHAVCIVPEKRQEVTTEGGLDVVSQQDWAIEFTRPLLEKNIEVSFFIDPDVHQIAAVAKTGAPFIELHTGRYSEAFGTSEEEKSFQDLKGAALFAKNFGLKVNAGHGLNYQNVHRMHEIPNLVELNIGHSIISRAIFVGLEQAVKEMKYLCENNSKNLS
ncbi:pyridoxine 5'-phosphate synthase [bacterium]|nr:pyridoxine 5'-phosphate synthase [bacterium]